MLAVTDRDGASTGRQAVLYATALLPVTLAAGLLAVRRGRLPLGRPRAGARRFWRARRLRLEAHGRLRRGGCSWRRSCTCRFCWGSWCSTDDGDLEGLARTAGSSGSWWPLGLGLFVGSILFIISRAH